MTDKKKNLSKVPDNSPKGPGKLYVVATPIGNLEDITLRAIRVLKEVDLIAAEDTRHTRKLLTHFKISTPTFSYFKEKEQSRSDKIVDRLNAGKDVALVSDAGTPGISDPGSILVQKAAANSIKVIPVPGPSSLTAALSVAGVTEGTFIFLGFAPSRKKQRQDLLISLCQEKKYLVFFEAPHRLHSFLQDSYDILGDRSLVWCRELTKLHEELTRDSLSAVLAHCKDKKIKGESVFIISGAADAPGISDTEIKELLAAYKKSNKKTLKDAVRIITKEYNLSRSSVYKLALEVWGKN
ncbi:MAG: 16S rRNA (cytidine(1402)-2'-O)-methyltransferase [Desulfobacterales bacterium]